MQNKKLSHDFKNIREDIAVKIKSLSMFNKGMAKKFVPLDDILTFVGKVVLKLEEVEKENLFLKDELEKINKELALQSAVLLTLINNKPKRNKIEENSNNT